MSMLIPRKNFDLFEDIFNDSFFENSNHRFEKSQIMKTDVKELENSYEIDMDLPGYEKENITLDIDDGYLTVTAKNVKENEEKDKKEKYIRKERFYGECSRSFYVGDNVTENDIKASFRNGILKLVVPKIEEEKHSGKKYIQIDD